MIVFCCIHLIADGSVRNVWCRYASKGYVLFSGASEAPGAKWIGGLHAGFLSKLDDFGSDAAGNGGGGGGGGASTLPLMQPVFDFPEPVHPDYPWICRYGVA